MQLNRSSRLSDSGFSPGRAWLSIGLPLILFLAFLGKQFLSLDGIGWSNGFSHPLTGWDHLLTMLAVGVWAAQLRGQAIWMLPLAFVGVMSLGGLAGAAGLSIPSVEGIILLSCAVFSVLITRKVRFSAKINVLIVAFFAFFHGFAHGQEISASASLISYTLGFMLATLLLHGAGILVAKLVVFSVTCFLTIVFSSAAQANPDETVAAVKIKNTAPVQVAEFGKLKSLWSASDQLADAYTSLAIADENSSANASAKSGVGPDNRCRHVSPDIVSTKTLCKSHNEAIKAGGSSQALALKQAVSPALDFNRGPQPLSSEYMCLGLLDFKHYFPDINHTPGKNLLSNGVGLTSPPLLSATVLVPRSSPAFRNTSNPSSEDLLLQLNFAKILIGNSNTETCITFRQSYALRNPFKAKVSAAPGRNNFAFSTPKAGLAHLLGLAACAISEFHLLNASSNRLPIAVLTARPEQPFTRQT